MSESGPAPINARAPGKVILFGEHAVNRGQSAVAASVGLNTACELLAASDGVCDDNILFVGAGRSRRFSREELVTLAKTVDVALGAKDYALIAALNGQEFFASSAYLLGRVLGEYPEVLASGARIEFQSEIPMSCGLGSGGAVHVALAVALTEALRRQGRIVPNGSTGLWAYWGDCVAHGGVASGLDTQTSLLGGVIEYRAGHKGRPLATDPGLQLVIGHTGIAKGSTGNVNARVRRWLDEDPSRISVFEEMGALATATHLLLRAGRWPEVGALMNEGHRLLECIGASHPDLTRLCNVALSAGAFGAKLTGAGGGGVMIALVSPETASAVAEAIRGAGGTSFTPKIAVPGAALVDV